MKDILKSIIISSILFFLFSIICGILRTELILGYVKEEIISMTRLSSYVSFFISGLIASLYLFAIMGGIYLILRVLKITPNHHLYKIAVRLFVLAYALNELAKTLIIHYSIKDYTNLTINTMESVNNLVEGTNLLMKIYVSDFACFLIATFLYILNF